ncbi:MAG: UDP-N-acetylmuramoyl-tripeptide--D-alanyl-D-alanine ligase [Clostridia bacterium]|nr:UDP-N-acetylmuramoyl-tripeptide--D-alanyl-D-alanine ligase [Clostridia bacterium]
MPRWTAAEVAGMAGARLAAGPPDVVVSGVTVDSRRVRPGDLFVALPGARVDGHDFAVQAVAAGAAAVLASRAVAVPSGVPLLLAGDGVQALGRLAAAHRRRLDLQVVAVTGSVGKTTTRELIGAILAARFRTLVAPANYNTEVGLPLALCGLEPEHQVAVVELAMRGPGQIAYLASLARPDVGVLTRIGESHLGVLGSVEAIVRAKAELLAALPAWGTAVLNRDDPAQAALSAWSEAPVVWYGLGEGGAVTARRVEDGGLDGTTFRLVTPRGEADARLPLPGRHLLEDALAAAAAAVVLGVSPEEVVRALATARPPEGRLTRRLWGEVLILDDTYNASPTSVRAALTVLASTGRRRVAVLGDMLELGEAAAAAHRAIGAAAAGAVDLLVTVGELARQCADAARTAGLPGEAVVACEDREEAVTVLRRLLRPGDTVLVKASRGVGLDRLVADLLASPPPGDGA